MGSITYFLVASSALLFAFAATAISLFFAVAFAIHGSLACATALPAAVLSIMDVIWLVYLSIWFPVGYAFGQTSVRISRGNAVVAVLPSVLALGSYLTMLVYMELRSRETSQTVFHSSIFDLLRVGWAMWTLSLVGRFAFFILLYRRLHKLHRANLTHQTQRPVLPNRYRKGTAPKLSSIPPRFKFRNSFLSVSSYYTDPKSARANESPPLREQSSRVRIIDSRNSPAAVFRSSIPANPFNFDTEEEDIDTESLWDSYSEKTLRSPLPGPPFGIFGRLETIPGSEPSSPAKSRETVDMERKQSDAEVVDRPKDRPNDNEADATNKLSTSTLPRKDSSLSQRRASSPSESHVHPLFRSDSQLPPPTPTPRTSVTAPAIGGLYVSRRSLSRPGSQSRPPSSDGGPPTFGSTNSTLVRYSSDSDMTSTGGSRMFRSRSVDVSRLRALTREGLSAPVVPDLPSLRRSYDSNLRSSAQPDRGSAFARRFGEGEGHH